MRIIIATSHVRASSQAVPLAAGCLRAALPHYFRARTKLLDLFPEQDDVEIIDRLLQTRPDLIAFPLYVWNRNQILRLTTGLRQRQPGIFLVAGGPEASADPHGVLAAGALNAVIRGEGEKPFGELVSRITGGQSPAGIEGLLLAREPEGQLPEAAWCPNLDELPSPWLHGDIPLEAGCGVLWEVARGCHFNCAFCYDAKGQSGVRPLPVERIRRELTLFSSKQVTQVWVLDSTFNAPPERGRQLLELLLATAPEIHYHIEAKVELLDHETIDLLSRLSCSVQIGLQSADAAVLLPLHRRFDKVSAQKKLARLSAAGVTFGLDLIYGLPGDSHAGFAESLDFALYQQPNQIDIFPLAVLPGTELHAKSAEFKLRGEQQPPYLVTENAGYSAQDMQRSRRLAAATDIFYNRGRAVGFFLQFCSALDLSPQAFLARFFSWLEENKNVPVATLPAAENWVPEAIIVRQREFIVAQLNDRHKAHLIPAALDLLHYHYCHAEMLLAAECRPAAAPPAATTALRTHWRLNPAVCLQDFHYPLDALEALGGEPLEIIARELEPEPTEYVFFRATGEVIIEELDPDFARLLQRARKGAQGNDLLPGPDRRNGIELLQFAISQGLLLVA